MALLGALGGVIVHDSTEPKTVVTTAPAPAPTSTTTVTKTVAPRLDQVAIARGLRPLAKLVKGDRVINEQNPARPLCTFQLWSGSIDDAMIQCGNRQITIKTGFLTPVEASK